MGPRAARISTRIDAKKRLSAQHSALSSMHQTLFNAFLLTMNSIRAILASIKYFLSEMTKGLKPGRALPSQSAALKSTKPKGTHRRG